MPEDGFTQADRDLPSLLAPLERRALGWMATRLPGWVTPDHLTLLGLAALVLAGLSYALAAAWPPALLLVNIWLAANWFGDSLDGTLARVRRSERPRYGFYVDHVVDMLGTFALVGGMALSGYMSPGVAMALLLAYFMVCIEVYLATYCRGTFRMAYWGLGATELRVVLAIGNVAAFLHPYCSPFGVRHLLFDAGGAVAAAGLGVTLGAAILRNTTALFRIEPLPPPATPGGGRRA